MSTGKLDTSGVFQPLTLCSQQTRLELPAGSARVCKNGIEFLSPVAIPAWTEMTVDLRATGAAQKVNCTGVVVSCSGNRKTGYSVSIVFMNLSRQAQERLNTLAHSQLD